MAKQHGIELGNLVVTLVAASRVCHSCLPKGGVVWDSRRAIAE